MKAKLSSAPDFYNQDLPNNDILSDMYNHEPEDYVCPFCLIVKGIENEHVYTKQSDIIYRDNDITAFIASHWWPKTSGHVLVIPNEHYENVYDIPDEILSKVQVFGKKVALALKEVYPCDATSFRQHNEEHGNQDVWHYHLHVFPRYKEDNFYLTHNEKRRSEPEERLEYARKLREYFNQNS